jgi:hypothetical protein
MNITKNHWENIYTTKNSNEVSWTEGASWAVKEVIPTLSLKPTAAIIDIGAGEALFAKEMFNNGFKNITVIDIALSALKKAKQHFGIDVQNITWIESDVLKLEIEHPVDLWYDRAVFHFLTQPEDIQSYIKKVFLYASNYVLIGTFDLDGPTKCSGLPIVQYSSNHLYKLFESNFYLVNSYTCVHRTPFGTEQSFQYILMKIK